MKRGKRYQEAAKLRDKTNLYDAPEAVAIVKKLPVQNLMKLSKLISKWVLTDVMLISRFVEQ